MLVGQRIRELALLRTLGARGGSLVRMLLIESITVGVVFSLIGALLTYPVGALVGANPHHHRDFVLNHPGDYRYPDPAPS